MEKWPLTFCLSGSLKVTATDTDQLATYDFLLVINRNCGPILHPFQDRQFGPKFANFPTPIHFTTVLNFVMAVVLKKN